MAKDDERALEQRIAEATEELARAQEELTLALSNLDKKERADKTMIETVLRDVLDRVTVARRKLDELVS